jgi:hypothetical protein
MNHVSTVAEHARMPSHSRARYGPGHDLSHFDRQARLPRAHKWVAASPSRARTVTDHAHTDGAAQDAARICGLMSDKSQLSTPRPVQRHAEPDALAACQKSVASPGSCCLSLRRVHRLSKRRGAGQWMSVSCC